MRAGRRQRDQRGAALLIMLAILGLGSVWFLVSSLNAQTGGIEAQRKKHNAEVLQRARQALIGYVAAQAAKAGEDNPGAFPCPEADGYFDNPSQEGQSAGSCTLPRVGRFPWRTIGTEKLVDASGEPLWYVVSPDWARQGGHTVINSDSAGRLTVDGVADAAVALLIAPGPAFNVAGNPAANCAARSQRRPLTGTPDLRNYLECENATSPPDANFVTRAPTGSFNDQVLAIRVEDVMPAIEAAVAHRIEREIAPALAGVFTPAQWGFGGANPLYPYPAPFANPGPGAGSSDYRGTAAACSGGICRGLLPFNQTQGCTESPQEPRCSTAPGAFLVFTKAASDVQTGGSGYIRTQSSCVWQASTFVCTGEYFQPSISVQVSINITNVAMGLRTFDGSKIEFLAMNDVPGGWGTQVVAHTRTVAMNANGSLTLTLSSAALPDIATAGWGTYANYQVRIERTVVGDHALLDSTAASTGWFARNGWYRYLQYAVAQSVTASALPSAPACTTGSDCLTVANMVPANDKRAILILGGRSVNGRPRPSATLADYFELGNASGSFERRPLAAAGGALHADTGAANAYEVNVAQLAAGASFRFRAANASTGAATLYTPATGTRPLVEDDGSPLANGRIQAQAAIEVVYDGTRFLLQRRPFNDRVIVIAANAGS